MFLKSMELMGFKSFADRTHIDFSSGISALLGPNGCGKSNIVDAVKWVLGEQSTRNMRALKMEDVIFNGTVKRKALNVAEVTLTISNETNILELDAPEIEIKRRLYRSGDSEYFINNAQVRLKELRELFFDTGIGKSAYSILEQGKIDQILSNRPEERRFLFEEAAGITRFKAKGQEAGRKLEKTRDNIRQAQNILTEVSRSYFSLKEQSEKTSRYRNLKDKLFEIEVNLQLLKIKKLRELHTRRGEEHVKRENSLEKLEGEIKKLGDSLGENHRELSKLKGELTEGQKLLYGFSLERDSIQNRITEEKTRVTEFKAQLDVLDDKQSKMSKKSSVLKENINSKKKEKDVLHNLYTNEDKALNSYVKELSKYSENSSNIKNEIAELRKSLEFEERTQDSLIDNLKDLSTKITDKLSNGLKEFSIEKHNTLVDLFRSQLKLARTNPSLLYKLEDDFNILIDSFPSFITHLLDDDDFQKKGEVDRNLNISKDNIISIKNEIKKSENKLESLNHNIEITNDLISKCKLSIVEIKTKLTAVEESIILINKNLEDEESILQEIKRERILLGDKIKQLNLDLNTLSNTFRTLKEKEIVVKDNIKEFESKISLIVGKNSNRERDLIKKRENLSSLTLQIERFNFESEHLEGKVLELYDSFKEKYSIELDDASTGIDIDDKSEEELRGVVGALKLEQKSIGQINLMAPEEFKEVSTRYHFLKGQIDDLTKADENLSRITKEIKDESTRLFSKTFEEIKVSFSKMYTELFGGGFAELQLTDIDNVLESGIEIYARPPGKSLENISLLSGGERSLTAVALLFATYSVKPSPFCILDEIDAALDERNISRFVTTLTDFAKESQFIVITHNKKTVTGAGALLGVTMEESGVSKLITMRLEHEEEE